MHEDRDEELSAPDQRVLASWRQSPAPPASLEHRVVSALRDRGLLRSGPPSLARRWRAAAAAAACLILFAAGAAVGARFAPAARGGPAGERFVLFLYEGRDYEAAAPGSERDRVEEYRQWAKEVRQSGSLVEGEKLKEGEQLLGVPGPVTEPGMTLGGYFVIAAPDAGKAREIASGCPHLRHRGRILIRQIDPV
jgi:hypothetical protein